MIRLLIVLSEDVLHAVVNFLHGYATPLPRMQHVLDSVTFYSRSGL